MERILNKWREQYFATMFEDIRYERSFLLSRTLTDPDIVKQSKVTDQDKNIIKKTCFGKNT